MESQIQNQSKPKARPSTESLRVKRETKKKILSDINSINKKTYGRRVTPDELVSLAVSLVTSEHLEQLKERSLTAKDRFEQRYLEYCKTQGKVSKDEFLATLLK